MIKKIIIFIAVLFIAMKIGGAIAYGLISLVGLIALIETVPFLKWLVKKLTSLIDVLIFIATLYATVTLGYNITASLMIVGLGYTLIYAPYVRREVSYKNKTRNNSHDTKDDYDWS